MHLPAHSSANQMTAEKPGAAACAIHPGMTPVNGHELEMSVPSTTSPI